MSTLDILVEHSDRLMPYFAGAWPSFHDAEIISIDLWRGDVCPEQNSWIGAAITVKILVLEATQPDASHAGNDHLVTLLFHDVDDIKLVGFNHQNAINGLTFSQEARGEGLTPTIRVEFVRGFGADISFQCLRVEVLQVEPYPPSKQCA